MDSLTQFLQLMSNIHSENRKSLKRLFSGKIKGTFLIEMLSKVLTTMNNEIANYYDMDITNEKLISSEIDDFEYDICRHIVGLHRSHLIFNTEEERIKKESSPEYKDLLANEVICNIKLRPYGSIFFRKKSILRGENFIFFHVPYDLFAQCIRINELLAQCKKRDVIYSIIASIENKGLSALTLLEDNLLDNAYPMCRGITELYIKLLILINYPKAKERFSKFNDFELQQSYCEQGFPQEFINIYNNRVNTSCNDRIDYLHYGWLDALNDYHMGAMRPYSINGAISYLKIKCIKESKIVFENIEKLYKRCHGYAHGNIIQSKYPLMHYFEISLMLYYAISATYNILCELLKVPTEIDGIDLSVKAENDLCMLIEQYRKCTTQNLELYYKLNKF